MKLLLSLWVCINPKTVRTNTVYRCNITTASNDNKHTMSKTPRACYVELLLIVHVLMLWYPFHFTVSSKHNVNLRMSERQ